MASERTITLDDGAATTLQTWGDRGPLLLCVHGMTSSRRAWVRLAKRVDGRYRVAAYDQRGHGDSANVPGPMALARAVADLANVAAALGEPIHAYVGHSWGGATVVRGGLNSAVDRVAAIDPMMHQVDDAWYDEYLGELAESFEATGNARDAAVREEYADWGADDIEGKVHAIHTMTVDPIAGLQRENTRTSWDLRGEIATYDRPLLLAVPDVEGSINDADVLESVRASAPPNVVFETFPGKGHNLHRVDFDNFAPVLERFLA